MAGRKWYDEAVGMKLTLRANALDRPLLDYIAGIMDTLGGSHGDTFTYLPIAFQDDCQVSVGETFFVKDSTTTYTLEIVFM